MKVCLTLICLFFLTLQDGEAAETHARMGGENITVECKFNFTGNPILFCKENCEEEHILINTTENRADKGRYSTLYDSNYTSASLYVSISDLKRSDSGRYRCGLGKNRSRYHEFHLDVTEATTSFSSYSSSSTTQQTTTSSEPKGQTDQLLYVGLSLVLIILLATALLIYCWRKRFHQQKGRPVDTNPPDLTINTVYEEIREDGRENKPPAGEISSVYVSVQPNKPNAAESNAIYSLASEPQCQAKEEAEYSEVQMLNDDNGSNGGHLGVSDNVMYSEPQLDMSSGSHGNGSPAIYSTITLEPELC
ncbi:uncharacterized protein LOC103132289 isoform X5 [Poecilia formosa]|uniref:uncharacterized protein LOC103132289 isoform X4 n=1 Tax=Poecilia formosa TaxID=48698 RepID=UPI000443D839|nr:PREDICTED: uncharacterized protein LOC103132289 isoform X4 [Poecilia formosa]XP_016522777.1 PREDICTED: uncharacterized protein LOC103132289 isoform X5 [Poecilia formosa]